MVRRPQQDVVTISNGFFNAEELGGDDDTTVQRKSQYRGDDDGINYGGSLSPI